MTDEDRRRNSSVFMHVTVSVVERSSDESVLSSVDGAETDHVDLYQERFYEVTQYVSHTRHLYLAVGLIFSRKLFDRLPPDIQEAVLEAGRASVVAERQAMAEMTESARAELVARGIEFNDVERERFLEKVQGVYERNAERVGGMEAIREVESQ